MRSGRRVGPFAAATLPPLSLSPHSFHTHLRKGAAPLSPRRRAATGLRPPPSTAPPSPRRPRRGSPPPPVLASRTRAGAQPLPPEGDVRVSASVAEPGSPLAALLVAANDARAAVAAAPSPFAAARPPLLPLPPSPRFEAVLLGSPTLECTASDADARMPAAALPGHRLTRAANLPAGPAEAKAALASGAAAEAAVGVRVPPPPRPLFEAAAPGAGAAPRPPETPPTLPNWMAGAGPRGGNAAAVATAGQAAAALPPRPLCARVAARARAAAAQPLSPGALLPGAGSGEWQSPVTGTKLL